MESLVKKNFLSELKRIDWDFTGENGNTGFSAYHWYPARYVPQVPGILINYFSEPGELVLDPFCGSGTTLVEAFRFGRRAVGIDLNPIAALITEAKLLSFDELEFSKYVDRILTQARILATQSQDLYSHSQDLRDMVPNYEENRSWYHKNTLLELASIWTTISAHPDLEYFKAGLAAFSAILRYCCSQDKHWGWICDNVKPKHMVYRDAFAKFSEKLDEYKASATKLQYETSELQGEVVTTSEIKVYQGNCIEIIKNFSDATFDLVVTSPPYYNMTDYTFSQRLSILWFGFDAFSLREEEIGARSKRFRKSSLDEYLKGMKDALSTIARVTKNGRFCCIVIGQSPRHESFLEQLKAICTDVGLEQRGSFSRRIPKRRSLSPILHHEEILILEKC